MPPFERTPEGDIQALLTGMLIGRLLGAGITAYSQVDEDGNFTDEVKIILHDQIYEPITVTVKVTLPT